MQVAHRFVDARCSSLAVGAIDRYKFYCAHSYREYWNTEKFLLDQDRDTARNRGKVNERIEIGGVVGDEDADTFGDVFDAFHPDANSYGAHRERNRFHRELIHCFGTARQDAPEDEPRKHQHKSESEKRYHERCSDHGCVAVPEVAD